MQLINFTLCSISFEKQLINCTLCSNIILKNYWNIQCCFELMCFACLLDCIPFWTHFHCHYNRQFQNEPLFLCLKICGLVELNHHNTFPSWVMYLNHHHKWSRNHSWKNRLFVFLIWQLQRIGTYLQHQKYPTSKFRKLISIVCPNCTWISQVKSRLLS